MARSTASLRSSTMAPPLADIGTRVFGVPSLQTRRVCPMADFIEVGDRVWVARYDWFDVNVGLVAGSAGLLVIDTNATPALGRDALEAVRRISAAPVLA